MNPLKLGPHQQQCQSNIVEATGNFVACCFYSILLPKTAKCRSGIQLGRSNIRLCSIWQGCFDIVVGVDGVEHVQSRAH